MNPDVLNANTTVRAGAKVVRDVRVARVRAALMGEGDLPPEHILHSELGFCHCGISIICESRFY
jgi:hypothetical protein